MRARTVVINIRPRGTIGALDSVEHTVNFLVICEGVVVALFANMIARSHMCVRILNGTPSLTLCLASPSHEASVVPPRLCGISYSQLRDYWPNGGEGIL